MSPKSRSADHRSSALGLELVAVRSEIVVSKWCSPYYQTLSKGKMRTRRALATGGPHRRSRKLAFGGVCLPTAYGTIKMSCFLARLVWQRFADTFASSLGRVPLGATRSP